jgi:uncharacterized membrane protein YidH (DUF202 family)
MEQILGPLILLGCGAFLFCMGALNWDRFIRATHSPLNLIFPRYVVRCWFALIGVAVMVIAVLILTGFDVGAGVQ